MFLSISQELEKFAPSPIRSKIIQETNSRMDLLEDLFNIEKVKRIRTIIEREKPDFIVVGNDGGVNSTYLELSNMFEIPTLVVQDGLIINTPKRGPLNLLRFNNYFLWRVLSKVAETKMLSHILLSAGWRTRVLDWGTGRGKTIAVMSEHSKDILLSRGVLETKIVITGSPLFDDSAQYASRFDEMSTRKNLGVKKHEYIVLWLTQPFFEDGTWSKRMRNELIQSVVDVTNNIDQLKLILKIHPRESLEDYKKILDKYNGKKIILVKDFNLNELILLSTAVLTVNSTAGVLAAVHKKPLILLDYFRDGSTQIFDDVGIKVCNSASLHEALTELIMKKPADSKYLKDNANNSVEKLLGKLDGQASYRVANVVLESLLSNDNSREVS
jgi:hypothetical protein